MAETTSEFNYAWLKFSKSDKKKYKEKYDDIMQIIGAPLPLPTGKIILQAIEEGKLEIMKDIEDIKYSEKSQRFYILEEKENMSSVERKVDWVLNATGLDLSMKSLKLEDSLLGKLIDKRYLEIDNDGGVTVLPNSLVSVSSRYGELDTLHVHGVLISGVVLRNNSVIVIQKAAHNLIKNLYK